MYVFCWLRSSLFVQLLHDKNYRKKVIYPCFCRHCRVLFTSNSYPVKITSAAHLIYKRPSFMNETVNYDVIKSPPCRSMSDSEIKENHLLTCLCCSFAFFVVMIANVPGQHIEGKVTHSETAIYSRNRPFCNADNKIICRITVNNKRNTSDDKAFYLTRLIIQ